MAVTTILAQISDTHISADRPLFNDNLDRVAECVRASRPDFLINTGDISLDGADSDADLALAVRRHRDVNSDVLLLAGNHDIGDDPLLEPRQPINVQRVARWTDAVGATHWRRDIPGWRLLGIDALILGTDLDEAHSQASTIRDCVSDLRGRSLALFLHKPVCDEAYAETSVSSRFLTPSRRAELFELLGHAKPAIVASGHVHQYRDTLIGGTRHIWAPAVAFMIADPWQPVYGAKTVGYLEHRFHADGTHDHRLVAVRGLKHYDLLQVPEAYGDIRRWGEGRA